MSEEERETLCYALRKLLNPPVNCLKAATEIERLAKENKQLKKRIAGLESEITCMSYDPYLAT
jgi:cell division protein FtsB